MRLDDLEAAEREALLALAPRMGAVHLRQRLGIEGEHEAHVVRRGTHFFHAENWYSLPSLMRLALRMSGLHARGRRNATRIRVRSNEMTLARLPRAFDGFVVLHLSDLHLDVGTSFPAHLARRVKDLRYDLCVLTGDFRYRTSGGIDAALDVLAGLRPVLRGPVLAVLGNHDSIRMAPRIEALDVRVLLNESVAIERDGEALHVAGIDDAHYFRTHDLHRAARAVPAGACALLLSHTPEVYRNAAHAGFDAMLCGHTHGGQICLPGGVPILTDSDAPRAYARGAWRYRDLTGYTSVGCGSSIIDVRLNCPPEVTLHRLRRG
jgi:predicted MPP superfamily phosphohydrolase